MNILVVDDEEIIRKGVRKTLENGNLNFENIYESSNGEEGLDVVRSNDLDIVILDINMPKKNGLELAKEIKAINSQIKIGIISGYDYFEYMREAIKIGVDDYILKPTTRNDILEMVKRLMDKVEADNKNIAVNKIVADINVENEDKMDKILEENIFKKEFNLSYLADALDLSNGYLSNVFKKKYGIPFQDYVLERRMKQAALLLLSTDMKNYDISEAIGFDSVYYFSIKFKKFFNMTPKEYKNKSIKGNYEK